MDSDKHLYEIFEAYPQWVFELTGRPWPGPCRFQSVTIKAIQRSADGVLIPEITDEAILVVEFQMYLDHQIYGRVVVEMAIIQEEHTGREVQGILMFGSKEREPVLYSDRSVRYGRTIKSQIGWRVHRLAPSAFQNSWKNGD